MVSKCQNTSESTLDNHTVRATLYLGPSLHQALRLMAARSGRSMAEIVNEALRAALREDEEDLASSRSARASPP
jgi:plasmid stability protein